MRPLNEVEERDRIVPINPEKKKEYLTLLSRKMDKKI